MGKLEGKIALITGGNSGIGLATAKEFVAEGAYVFITGRRQPELDAAVKQIGKNIAAIQGDVSKLADLDRVFATIKEKKSHLDIIFANAGGGSVAPLAAVTEAQFDKEFGINVKGVLFTVQKALPLLRDGASIIINGSIAGIKGIPAFTVYSATKAPSVPSRAPGPPTSKTGKFASTSSALAPSKLLAPIICSPIQPSSKPSSPAWSPAFPWAASAPPAKSPNL